MAYRAHHETAAAIKAAAAAQQVEVAEQSRTGFLPHRQREIVGTLASPSFF